MRNRAYLDTDLLYDMVSDKQDEKQETKQLIRKIQSSFDIIIPQIVVGEFFSTLIRDNNEESTSKKLKELSTYLYQMLDRDICIPAPSIQVFECVSVLKDRDKMLEPTDVIIVSHALTDPDSNCMFTTDQKLIHSDAIHCLETEMRQEKKRNTKLTITDSLWKD